MASGRAQIYGLFCPISGELRYIGKANNAAKRLATHIRDSRRRDTPVYRWIRKLAVERLVPVMRVLDEADDWQGAERRLISVSRAQGDRLLNVAEGGDAPHCTQEARFASACDAAQRRRDCVIEYTCHRFFQVVGYTQKNAIERGQHVLGAQLCKAAARLRGLSKEALFWRIFCSKGLRNILPIEVQKDAEQFWAIA